MFHTLRQAQSCFKIRSLLHYMCDWLKLQEGEIGWTGASRPLPAGKAGAVERARGSLALTVFPF